jgi:hypothetical protein
VTTDAQIKKMLRPLLERNSDLAYFRRMLFIKPIRHVFRGVLFDGTSVPHGFSPRWLVNHTFNKRFGSSSPWTFNITWPRPGGWLITRPDIDDLLSKHIEQEAIPMMRPVRELETLTNLVDSHWRRDVLFDHPSILIIQSACGNLESARWDVKRADYFLSTPVAPTDADYVGKVRKLCTLLEADDLKGLVAHLHAWEEQNVRENKLERWWEPSPFPLEELI